MVVLAPSSYNRVFLCGRSLREPHQSESKASAVPGHCLTEVEIESNSIPLAGYVRFQRLIDAFFGHKKKAQQIHEQTIERSKYRRMRRIS